MVFFGKHIGLEYILVEASNLEADISRIQIEGGPKLIPVVTLSPDDRSMLSSAFGRRIIFLKARSYQEIVRGLRTPQVSVISVSLGVLSEALKNSRILHLFAQYNKFLELQFREFIIASSRVRAGFIKMIRRSSRIFNNKKLRLFVSSRATSVYEMISPRFLRACLSLLGFKDYTLKRIFKEVPKELVLTPLEVVVVKEGGEQLPEKPLD